MFQAFNVWLADRREKKIHQWVTDRLTLQLGNYAIKDKEDRTIQGPIPLYGVWVAPEHIRRILTEEGKTYGHQKKPRTTRKKLTTKKTTKTDKYIPTGEMGVYQVGEGAFYAKISQHSKGYHLGSFASIEEAKEAYAKAKIRRELGLPVRE